MANKWPRVAMETIRMSTHLIVEARPHEQHELHEASQVRDGLLVVRIGAADLHQRQSAHRLHTGRLCVREQRDKRRQAACARDHLLVLLVTVCQVRERPRRLRLHGRGPT